MRVSTPRLPKGPPKSAVVAYQDAVSVLPVAPVCVAPEPAAVEADTIPNAEDRAPAGTDNPRHVVLICDDRNEIPRRVPVPNPGEHSVKVDGAVYHHTHEAGNGQWIYTRLISA